MKEEKKIKLDGKEIFINHPNKILFYNDKITKQELIEYYTSVQSHLMKISKGRLLSIVRFPHGYPGESFFQKNKPKWAPDWIESEKLGVEKPADYIILENMATLIWLVNLGSLEFHTAQVAAPEFLKPNVLVFDLDPPDGANFLEVRDFALHLKPIIESFGYHPFVKTSGKRGVHIYCPIEPRWSFDEVFAAAKEVGEYIVTKNKNTTLKISKSERKQKILVDIYRNHSYQSMVMPFSVRAIDKVSVSMPLAWEDFEKIKSPGEFTLHSVPNWMKTHSNPWARMHYATTPLHT